MVSKETKEQQLHRLFMELFRGPEDLTRFLKFGLQDADVYAELPIGQPLAPLAYETVDLLRRRGLVDANLFSQLAALYPGRAARVQQVARAWINLPESAPPVEHAIPTTGTGRRNIPRIFVSYSHRDRTFVEELSAHLRLLQRQGLVEVWTDSEITAGQEWSEAIDNQLNSADIILLMVSSNFLASEFCWGVEMSRALERHAAGSAVVIPVLLRPCLWDDAPFAKLQAVPRDAKPISMHRNTDEAWVDVALEIRTAVERVGRGGR
jgi:hypothetical protein